MDPYAYTRKPNPWQADLGLSIRKVSNGYSVKINHSQKTEDVGRIIVANSEEEVFKVLHELFKGSEEKKIPKGKDLFDAINEEYERG